MIKSTSQKELSQNNFNIKKLYAYQNGNNVSDKENYVGNQLKKEDQKKKINYYKNCKIKGQLGQDKSVVSQDKSVMNQEKSINVQDKRILNQDKPQKQIIP